jgi:hypothetical protein
MRIPREFFEQFSVEQRMEMLRDPDMLKNAYLVFGNTETKLDTPKPASDYVEIPDWLEAEIMALDRDYALAMLIRDLGLALFYGEWDVRMQSKGLSDRAYELIEHSNRDTFKALLQWIAMELI